MIRQPPPADALREAAWNLADSLLVNDFTHSVSGGVAAHYWREKVLAALAAAPAPGLDVERLARALDAWWQRKRDFRIEPWADAAPSIAAEYARLAGGAE